MAPSPESRLHADTAPETALRLIVAGCRADVLKYRAIVLTSARPTGIHGAPFFAINGMSRQELDWGGNVCVQAGWAWRGRRSEKLFRVGMEYQYGSDPQYEFVYSNQNRTGIGMWYDF